MLASILESIFSALLSAVFKPITDWLTARKNVAAGRAAQAAKETAVTAQVEDAELQAVVNAPKTDAELDERLDKGTF